MKEKILKLRNYLLGSFWFIPLLLIIAAFVLAYLSLELDKFIDSSNFKINDYLSGSVEGYRQILSTIGGSMMTIAGIVFSGTLVALTMTASQFGSRILKNFMEDKLNQIVLGSYIATFTYCLLILRIVKPEKYISYTPDVSILVAIILGIANIILLVFFIHHTANSIQAETITTQIGNELVGAIKKQNPGERYSSIQKNDEKLARNEEKKYNAKINIQSDEYGYIEYIDIEEIKNIAEENNILIKINKKVGTFLLDGEIIGTIYSQSSKGIILEALNKIKECIYLGGNRTLTQDTNFIIKQLIEIALRALSPGINDPHTAISCIDKFSKALGILLEQKVNTNYIFDENEILRVEINTFSFQNIVNSSFGVIRQYAQSSPDVLKHLNNSLKSLIKVGELKQANKEKMDSLNQELENLQETIRNNIKIQDDLKYIENGKS